MRWTPGGRSANLEDRRGTRLGRRAPLGIGGLLIALLLSLIFGQDFLSTLGLVSEPRSRVSADPARDAQEEPMVQFVSFVLDDAQNTWRELLGPRYQDARLVLFRDAVESACGFAQAVTGPFYCPADQKVYIDLSFYEELNRQFGAPGDFAQAYVLAHEIGHHVQNLLGIEQRMHWAQRTNPARANLLSVGFELQADCLAYQGRGGDDETHSPN